MEIVINYYAVVVAAVASFIVGWAWHSPLLFMKPWMQSIGMSMDGQKPDMAKMMPAMLVGLVGQLVLAVVFAHNIAVYQLAGVADSTGVSGVLSAAVWTWLGFMAVKHLDLVLWEKRSWKWFAIAGGYSLVQLLVMAAILVNWTV